jgi:hypothetical protein
LYTKHALVTPDGTFGLMHIFYGIVYVNVTIAAETMMQRCFFFGILTLLKLKLNIPYHAQ